MPMAHGGSDHEKNTLGFLATLCTSNGVIQVDLNTTADQPQPAQQTTVELSTKCTFCNYLEHDEMIVLNTTPHAIYTQLSARNPSGSQLLLAGSLLDSSAIRAPPQT